MRSQTINGQKKCSKCGITKPATTEYFHRKNRSNSFRNPCRECRRSTPIRVLTPVDVGIPGSVGIPLNKGYFTIVDDVDADLAEFMWGVGVKKNGYATAFRRVKSVTNFRRQDNILMHRVILARILDRPLLTDELVDHKDLNALNNRRSNLRLADPSKNFANRPKLRTSSNTYKGVTRMGNSWAAYGRNGQKQNFLGCYSTEIEAAIVYNHTALEQYGEFALVNDIPGWELLHPVRLRKKGYKGE